MNGFLEYYKGCKRFGDYRMPFVIDFILSIFMFRATFSVGASYGFRYGIESQIENSSFVVGVFVGLYLFYYFSKCVMYFLEIVFGFIGSSIDGAKGNHVYD